MTMLEVVVLILMILAVVLLGLAAFWTNPARPPRFSLGWAGLFCWALADLLPILMSVATGPHSRLLLRH